MNERSVSVYNAFSYLLWPAGLTLVLVGLFTKWELGQLGIVLCMMGATLTVRSYFCALERRERSAYQLGRESVRSIR